MRPLQKNELCDSAWREGKTPFELKINQLRMFLKHVFLIHYHSWPKGHKYDNEQGKHVSKTLKCLATQCATYQLIISIPG